MADPKDTGGIVIPEDIIPTNIEIIEPEKAFIDETKVVEIVADEEVVSYQEPGEFEKIQEDTENIDGVFITTRKIVPMTYEEKLAKRIQTLKEKIIDGTITATERDDLKLLIS